MYFKKLELVGFKSFCDKTTLNFEPGITAVVGPNGCGKSNIFDSIRWVLGEQSAKSLRGSEMLDVIFNGTDSKEAVGMSEVTLTFDNANRFFNVENDEVAITRRLFRSGESEYLLNKTNVRLKDILDILMGTGIGAESYSIVAQGKIDLVLSSRPEDRRLVFDEASGITKYKSQKRETVRRLEETEQNLLRVNDIVTEVKRQIGSLERQANKARRYKEVFEELKAKEISLSVLQRRKIVAEKDDIAAQLKKLELRENELSALLREQEAKIANRQAELIGFEGQIHGLKKQIYDFENQIVRSAEHAAFNRERIIELGANKKYMEAQIGQVNVKLAFDEENLNKVKSEYGQIRANIDEKSAMLMESEARINDLACGIKSSLDNISQAKRNIMDLAAMVSAAKNNISEFNSQEQVYLHRKKRLEIEKARAYEEKSIAQDGLDKISHEVDAVKNTIAEINLRLSVARTDLEGENSALAGIEKDMDLLEREKLTLESHREFLEKLKTKYEDISESMNAVIYLDKMPTEDVSGLVIKIMDRVTLSDEDKAYLGPASFKLSGEAKPMELDTHRISEKIIQLEERLAVLKNDRSARQARIEDLNKAILSVHEELRAQEISLGNKEHTRATGLEQFNKIKEEEDLIVMELADIEREISALKVNLSVRQGDLGELEKRQKGLEVLIADEEANISENGKLREDALVSITRTKTELSDLNKRVESDESTLRLMEEAYAQGRGNLANLQRQIEDAENKKVSMEGEIRECESRAVEFEKQKSGLAALLAESEGKYQEVVNGSSGAVARIETDRQELDGIKNRLYQLQMQNKDVEYKYSSMKERMSQAYKIDLDTLLESQEVLDAEPLSQEIARLKDKIDSYGSVNLVAIEEYDELKKRYDFLIQQQSDLAGAKESLHQAMLKLNRTTKAMFMETFEKVRVEFRSYFRMLFNGGDAQVFLTDENDPLESGIEIICRPPGKKLQNVLLLSGGEKAMSAIALIFAIFKVKPSPFCILDEIDAALDEANVDRFSRVLQEFAKGSQFIVITHNKRTIANADVMYGITMQQSGISRIVSVKFARDEQGQSKEKDADKEPDAVAAGPV